MEKNLIDLLKNTHSFKEFLSTNVTTIDEDEYNRLRHVCINEMKEEKPDFVNLGFFGNMSWFTQRQRAFAKLFESLNIKIKLNSEFERRLRDYIKLHGPNPGIGPIGKTEWYSQKRKELEDIIKQEDTDVGS